MDEPTIEEWRSLYDAAREFKQSAPWEWLMNEDVFGVRDPESGEIGWCVVLGAGRELFGLGIYLGDHGFDLMTRLHSGEIDPDVAAFQQRGLLAEFGDREELDERDRAVIKALGLRFRGRKAWPQFRSCVPDHAPWYLERAEARYLATALRQSLEVAHSCRAAADLEAFLRPAAGVLLVRSAPRPGEGFTDEHVRPDPPAPEADHPPVDRVRLQRILKDCERVRATWEFDVVHSPVIIGDGEERPYFALLALTVDHAEGAVVCCQVKEPPHDAGLMREQFLEAMHAARAIPAKVRLRGTRALLAIEPIAGVLKVDVEECADLEALETARGLLDSMMNSQGE